MTQVAIEPIREAMRVLAEFNRLDLASIILTEGGKPIPGVTPALIEGFRFVGLSNKEFVDMEWWNIPAEQLTWKKG